MNLKLVGEVEKFPILYNHKFDGYAKRDSVDAAWENVAKAIKDTASNCKERWRNLRTVFVRKLKLLPSGSSRKNKKPYYLIEATQFVLPFVKTQNTEETPGNAPSPPESESIEGDHAEEICLKNEEHEKDNSGHTEDNSRYTEDNTSYTDDNSEQIQPQSIINKPNVDRNPEKKVGSPAKKKQKQAALTKIDRAFMEFVELKKRKPTTEDDPRKLFLLSLLPEIQKLSAYQMRMFRRKVLDALDDVLVDTPSPAPTPCGSRTSSAGGNYYSLSPQFDLSNTSSQLSQVRDGVNTSQYFLTFTPEQCNQENYIS